VKLGEFNTIKSQISAALRKAGGSLAVRDISNLVKPGQLVDSENLTTLFVVVGKYSVKDWETCYEKLADFVVSVLHTSIRVACRGVGARVGGGQTMRERQRDWSTY
jgi:V-type H+-transporting ATPase subunit C